MQIGKKKTSMRVVLTKKKLQGSKPKVKKRKYSSILSKLLIDERRKSDIIAGYVRNKGRRIFVLMSSFPFSLIGTITDVKSSQVNVQIENAYFSEIEGKSIWINSDSIQAFYIEKPGFPQIPSKQERSLINNESI